MLLVAFPPTAKVTRPDPIVTAPSRSFAGIRTTKEQGERSHTTNSCRDGGKKAHKNCRSIIDPSRSNIQGRMEFMWIAQPLDSAFNSSSYRSDPQLKDKCRRPSLKAAIALLTLVIGEASFPLTQCRFMMRRIRNKRSLQILLHSDYV
jgi:hypothetical protein